MRVEPNDGAACEQLRAEHRLIESELDRLERVVKDGSSDLATEVRRCLAAIQCLSRLHFDKEERVLYPYLRSALPQLIAQLDQQHGYTREVEGHLAELLRQISGTPDARQADELARFALEFADVIQHHIVEEEDQLLRLAQDRLTPVEQRDLAEQMRRLEPAYCLTGEQ